MLNGICNLKKKRVGEEKKMTAMVNMWVDILKHLAL